MSCSSFELRCDNETGPIYIECNDTGQFCENDACATKKEEETHSVIIEIDEIKLIDLNMTDIQKTLSDLTDIEADKIRIRVVPNRDNAITHIIVTVDDETTAEYIKVSINDAIKQ